MKKILWNIIIITLFLLAFVHCQCNLELDLTLDVFFRLPRKSSWGKTAASKDAKLDHFYFKYKWAFSISSTTYKHYYVCPTIYLGPCETGKFSLRPYRNMEIND
jgi:hypothetical protein